MKKLMLSVFALVAFGFSANAVNFAAGTSSVNLSSAIGVEIPATWTGGFGTSVSPGALLFGNIAIGSAEAIYVISTLGGLDKSLEGTAQHLGGTVSAAGFKVSGTDGATFGVTATITTALNGTGAVLSDLTTNVGGTIGLTGTLGASGAWVSVGGKLTIAGDASTGTHAGAITLTVDYN